MKKTWMVVGIILGLVFLYVGYVYFTHSAGTLPGYFPGHLANSSHVHTKHGIAAVVVGLGCFVFAWFKSGPTTT